MIRTRGRPIGLGIPGARRTTGGTCSSASVRAMAVASGSVRGIPLCRRHLQVRRGPGPDRSTLHRTFPKAIFPLRALQGLCGYEAEFLCRLLVKTWFNVAGFLNLNKHETTMDLEGKIQF